MNEATANPKPVIPSCLRSGMCCSNIPLRHSPRQLRESFRAWRESKPDITTLDQIHLIFPMLEGRCRGKKVYPDGEVRYIYGPCAHLFYEEKDGKRLAGCRIHDDKPRMCSGYPRYGRPEVVEMTDKGANTNPANDQGCGFNVDPNAGRPREFYAELIPLTDEEK